MLPDQAVSPAIFRKLLTCWLCLLAVVFAIEAKTAWYGTAAGPVSAVRFDKALPADLPQVVSHGIPTPDPIHPAIPFLVFAVFVLSANSSFRMTRKATRGTGAPAAAPCFSPHLFFRPPPAL
jgi:hypothetical protein